MAIKHQMPYNAVVSEQDWNLLSVRSMQMLAFSSDVLLIKQEHQTLLTAFKTCVPIACGVLLFQD